ncbi:MAG: response regulator [Desulfobacterales bacterium]|nr:response regulator [Desulfobacterales bacterium]
METNNLYKGHVLAVDDTPSIIEYLEGILSHNGYKVTYTYDPDKVIKLVKKDPPDLILMDVMMQDKTGYDVCEELKKDEKTKDIPLIFMTILDDLESKVKGLSVGGVDYITKPFHSEELLLRVETHISLYRLDKTLKQKNKELQNEILKRKETENELLSLFKAMDAVVIIFDNEGRYIKIAPTIPTLLYNQNSGLLSKTVHEVLPTSLADYFLEKIHESLRKKDTLHFEYNTLVREKKFWFDAKVSPISEDKVIWVARDITSRKELEENLIEMNKMKTMGTLAGGIAHNFNNILSIVVGYTQLALYNEVPEDSPAKESLKSVLKACRRAKDLVNQILIFSCKHYTSKSNISIGLIIKETVSSIKPSLPSNIELKYQIEPDTWSVLADGVQIQQILLNLVANSIDSMTPQGGLLKIELRNLELKKQSKKNFNGAEKGSYVQLSVSDTGYGINENIQDRIFDPFFTTKDVGKGLGMGLSVTHGIVKNHNGFIYVKSKVLEGTDVSIIFPRALDTYYEPEKNIEEKILNSANILLVDDEEMVGTICRKLLELLGYRVTFEENSLESLEIFKNNPDKFDLVLLDIEMPNMNGEDLAKEILKIRADIPVVFITGHSSRIINDEKTDSLGISGVVFKPFSKNELYKVVSTALSKGRNQK